MHKTTRYEEHISHLLENYKNSEENKDGLNDVIVKPIHASHDENCTKDKKRSAKTLKL